MGEQSPEAFFDMFPFATSLTTDKSFWQPDKIRQKIKAERPVKQVFMIRISEWG